MDDLTVVVPVRDRPEALAAALASLAAAGPVPAVVVVDDGSAPAAAARTSALAARAGARLVRGRGEGPPRPATSAPRMRPPRSWSSSTATAGPGAVAGPAARPPRRPGGGRGRPRVVAAPRGSVAERYEAARSPLDMGPHPDVVRLLGRVPYVPSAALALRRAAFPGFDPAMPIGEDVDLVWRIRAAGWTVRHEPAAVVVHDHRRDLRGLLARRVVYGTSVAGLWARHPGAVPPLVLAPAQALVWGAAAAGVPGSPWAPPSRPRPSPSPPCAAPGCPCRWRPASSCAPGSPRPTWSRARSPAGGPPPCWRRRRCAPGPRPVRALGAPIAGRAARVLAVAAVTRAAVAGVRDRPAVDPLRWLALCALDDGANALGVWLGCLRHRTAAPLLPRLRAASATARTARTAS